jgi:hypothetical protein
MNVIFDTFIRFFTAVCNDPVQLTQNESPYMISKFILYRDHRNGYTEQT